MTDQQRYILTALAVAAGVISFICFFGWAVSQEHKARCYEVQTVLNNSTETYLECCNSHTRRNEGMVRVCGTLYPADRSIVRRLPAEQEGY